MIIKLRENISADMMNRTLEDYSIQSRFVTEESNTNWLNEINSGLCCQHLKPKDRFLTMDELKKLFSTWTEVGLFETDLYFGRTPEAEMQEIARFIVDNADSIEYISQSELLIERGNIPQEYHSKLCSLQRPEKEPEKLPESEQYIPSLEGGLLLCKSYSPNPFWVVFGKVESPTFLKEKIYVDNHLNNIYRDSKGLAYLLIPTMPFMNHDETFKFVERVYKKASQMGLREDPNFFLPFVYKIGLGDLSQVAESFRKSYTKAEIKKRMDTVLNNIKSLSSAKISFSQDGTIRRSSLLYTDKVMADLYNALAIALSEIEMCG